MAASTMLIAMESSCISQLPHQLPDENRVWTQIHEVSAGRRIAGSGQRLGRRKTISLQLVVDLLGCARHIQGHQDSLVLKDTQIGKHVLIVLIHRKVTAIEKLFVGVPQLEQLLVKRKNG